MITTHHTAPITEIHIDEATLRVPRGFRVGTVCPQPGGNYWYVIRESDGRSVLCRATPCAAEVLSTSQLRDALHAACDAK